MFYHTYDRLQGAWWGAIVAQRLTERSTVKAKLPDFYCQPWLVQRRTLATMLLEPLPSSPTLSGDRITILSLLPSIVFSTEPLITHIEEIFLSNSGSETARIEAEQNIIAWKYLLTTVSNHKFSFARDKLIESARKYCQTRENLLTNKLGLILELIAKGASLNLAVEKLSTDKSQTSTAIALAWYCFATTPHDFYLSIRKAAIVPQNLAWLTIALTSTLSGAYNGMAEISRHWRTDKENTYEQIEHHLFEQLFAKWLGTYTPKKQPSYLNPNLDAVAIPRIIQPRLSLKIISQISNLK